MALQLALLFAMALGVAFGVGHLSRKPLRRLLILLWAIAPVALLTVATLVEHGSDWKVLVAGVGTLMILAPWALGVLIGYSWSRERQQRAERLG